METGKFEYPLAMQVGGDIHGLSKANLKIVPSVPGLG